MDKKTKYLIVTIILIYIFSLVSFFTGYWQGTRNIENKKTKVVLLNELCENENVSIKKYIFFEIKNNTIRYALDKEGIINEIRGKNYLIITKNESIEICVYLPDGKIYKLEPLEGAVIKIEN